MKLGMNLNQTLTALHPVQLIFASLLTVHMKNKLCDT